MCLVTMHLRRGREAANASKSGDKICPKGKKAYLYTFSGLPERLQAPDARNPIDP